MRYLMICMCASTLVGCASTGSQQTSVWNKWFGKDAPRQTAAVENKSTLPDVDFDKKLGLTDQYFLGKFSLGSWVNQKPGQLFQPVQAKHPEAALVYFYRTDSRWNRQEIIPMNFQLNGERIPSLLNNHYYWIELPAGKYRLSMSRPAVIAHFQKPKVADFTVEAGKSYYLKYEEQKFKGAPDAALGLLKVGPLMQMPTKQGQQEISSTQLKTPGMSFIKYDQANTQPLGANVHQVDYEKVSKSQLSDKALPVLKKPFSPLNPLTW